MQSLNLVFVPFCEFLVGERTPDLTTIKGNGIDSSIFSQILIGMSNFMVLVTGPFLEHHYFGLTEICCPGLAESVQKI